LGELYWVIFWELNLENINDHGWLRF
jgi:hypothetical protein